MSQPQRNLEPFQYQIGGCIFGAGTMLNVESFDIGGHEVSNQDHQSTNADEILFGTDSLKPMPIQMVINAFKNYLIPNVVALTQDKRPTNFENQTAVSDFSREWRFDEGRKQFGAMKNMYIARKDGTVVEIFGRPGKFQVTKEDRSNHQQIVAEFRRADTLAYSTFEWFTKINKDEVSTIWRSSERGDGDAPCWFRIFLVGPMTNPIVQFGDQTIELQHELEAGDIVEISSYPWQRRVIDLATGNSLRSKLVRPYLKDLQFNIDEPIRVSWNATNANVNAVNQNFATYANTTDGLPTTLWYPVVYTPGLGNIKVQSGKVVWVDNGNQDRLGSVILKEQTASIYQKVGMTMATPPEGSLLNSPRCSNRIIGRSNTSGTEYLFWDISYTHVYFGYHKDGIDYQVSPIKPFRETTGLFRRIFQAFASLFGGDDPQNNWKYDAEFGTGEGELGSNLKINDVMAFNFGIDQIPPTNQLPPSFWSLSASNRNVGFGMRTTNRFLGQSTPGPLTEFHMRDNEVLAPNVSGVHVLWRDAWQNI